ncbi:MAG: hypothetical protein K2F81_04215 [Ruminococcus sp.]|nr:hypothetical protein [Ruminococcus sp.]
MAKYCITNGFIYDNGKNIELKNTNGSDIRIQAFGTGKFKVNGKLTANGTAKTFSLIRLKDFAIVEEIEDNEIYACDITGFYSISTEDVTGVDKVYATIYSD